MLSEQRFFISPQSQQGCVAKGGYFDGLYMYMLSEQRFFLSPRSLCNIGTTRMNNYGPTEGSIMEDVPFI